LSIAATPILDHDVDIEVVAGESRIEEPSKSHRRFETFLGPIRALATTDHDAYWVEAVLPLDG
jgi:hypothetical protein